MYKLITTSLFIYLIFCNSLYADVKIKGDFESIGNIYITEKYIENIKPEEYLKLAKGFDVTETVVKNFFRILKKKQVPPEDLDSTFRKIVPRHKELQSRLKQFNSLVDPEIQKIRKKAEQAINNGNYDKADTYLSYSLERQMVCINNAEKKHLINCKLSAAEMKANKGDLDLILINYKAATKLYKEAVELVPDGYDLKKAEYLQKWGGAARDAGFYSESQVALEKCLEIREKLLPKDNLDLIETINNLAVLYSSQGKYEEAEPLYKRLFKTRYQRKYKEYLSLLNKYEKKFLKKYETIVMVVRILERSQAKSIGIQKGDIIQSYLGNKLKTAKELIEIVNDNANSNKRYININIVRNGEIPIELYVRPGKLGVQVETIDMSYISSHKPITQNRKSLSRLSQADSLSDGKTMLDRNDLPKSLRSFIQQTRMRPHFSKGKPDGVSFNKINRNSIFSKMSLKNGDIIQGINGSKIKTIDDSMYLYQQLYSASDINLEIKRGGKRMIMQYQIR